ncbi:hypothetical protein G7054_g7574 [Neopestalotiopsis clavispora]|nr:hypothetical protein G7054_g7574 [Neopestalotiopsis clavispora]
MRQGDPEMAEDQSEPTRGNTQFNHHDDTRDLELQRHSTAQSVDNTDTTDRLSATEAALRAMARIRPDNGHGCTDLQQDTDEIEGSNAEKTNNDEYLVRWDGDKDPFCPRSRGLLHKWVIVVIVGMGSLCVILGSASAESLERVLRSAARLYCFMARFFDGFAGSAFLSVSGGTVSDLFRPDAIQAPMIIISMAPFVGPSLGPLLGGFINYNVDWRWTFYVMLIWAGVMMVCVVVLVPETYHPIQLREKARHLRKTTKDGRWKSPMELSEGSVLESIKRSCSVPFQLLVYEPICLLLCLYSAILLGILYLFFGAFSLVFGNVYGFNLWQIGLAFLGILIGMIAASATKPIWHRINMRLLERNGGVSEPEFQLPSAVAGGVLVPIGLFWFAWTIYAQVHWIVPIIGSGVFGMGFLLVFTGIFTFLVDAYPAVAASALAANVFTRCAFAAAFPLFGIQMYNKLNYHWASSLLAFLTAAMLPFPWLFFRYGKQLRKKSKFAQA